MDEAMGTDRLAAEQRARVLIDAQLRDAGWSVQDRSAMNLFAGQGVAVRETIMAKDHDRASLRATRNMLLRPWRGFVITPLWPL